MNELQAQSPLFVDHEKLKAIKATAESVLASGLLPSHIKTAQQAVAIILKGQELGLPPMASLSHVYSIGGKAEIEGTLMQSVLQRGGVAIQTVESTDLRCELKMTRAIGGVIVSENYSFTMDEAKKANLLKNAVWTSYPKDMLYWRALSRGARRIGADLIHGCYVRGELSEVIDVPVILPSATVAPTKQMAKDPLTVLASKPVPQVDAEAADERAAMQQEEIPNVPFPYKA